MQFQELFGFGLVVAFVVGLGLFVSSMRLPRALKRLIYAALALRVLGACARYLVLFEVYRGAGDARGYYGRGLAYAQRFWSLDFSPFYDPRLWFRGTWTETSFISFPSGIILGMIGPSLLGEFVAFSMLAFVGLAGFAIAFRRVHPDVPLERYARWIWLFPSLWFWPSSVGKEAVIMMGIGLAMAGFIGLRHKVQWLPLVAGTFLVYAVRPQVAAVLILTFMLAYWLSFGQRWTFAKTAQGVALLCCGLVAMWLATERMGVGGFDLEGLQEYMESEASAAADGGSDVGAVGVSATGIPMALVNILTRPWPWEARNAMALLSAMEMLTFWGIVWYRRKNVRYALRTWKSNPLLRVAIPFVLLYSIALGMLVVNLGIIARQRVFLFPFLFLLVEAAPSPRPQRLPVGPRRALRQMPPSAMARRM